MYASVHFSIARRAGMKLLMAVFGFGICIIIFGLSSIYWVSLKALLLSGMIDGVSMMIRQTILQLKTPEDMRGRVASVNSIFIGSSNELGAFESGLTAKLMGTVRAVIFGGCMTVMTVVGTGFAFPDLRSLDLTDDMEEG
jgi:predicted MFS family arabinose efflux permease